MGDKAPVWIGDDLARTLAPEVDSWSLPRSESRWSWKLLDRSDRYIGDLDGVRGARLRFSVHDQIRSGGSLTWRGKPKDEPDWTNVRVQPWYSCRFADGSVASWPLGVFIGAASQRTHGTTHTEVPVQLYDKLLLLSGDGLPSGLSLGTATAIPELVAAQIQVSAPGARYAIEDSSDHLGAPSFWEAGTSRLAVVNDLLDAGNYFSLWVDGYGVFRSSPYTAPQSRGVSRRFVDDETSIYLSGVVHEQDTFGVPNRVTLTARTDGDVFLVATAENIDPASPSSYPARGRWVTAPTEQVEATSLAALQGLAGRRLASLSRSESTYTVTAALTDVRLNDVVSLTNGRVGIDVRAVAQTIEMDCTFEALSTLTLREVR